MRYETSGPFNVGEQVTIKLRDCPEGYEANWSVNYGNMFIFPTTGNEVTVTALDEEPAQLYVECCEPDND